MLGVRHIATGLRQYQGLIGAPSQPPRHQGDTETPVELEEGSLLSSFLLDTGTRENNASYRLAFMTLR